MSDELNQKDPTYTFGEESTSPRTTLSQNADENPQQTPRSRGSAFEIPSAHTAEATAGSIMALLVGDNMSAHHVEITLAQDGKLMLDELPFRAGDTVEVIILARHSKPNGQEYPLRGQPIRYVEPTDPVAEAEWDAIQ